MFVVMCRVTGGVTGTRQAPLKRDGVVQTYVRRSDAEYAAAELYRSYGSQGHLAFSGPQYSYWVEEQS
jgi:hypothetical protein